MEVTSGGNMLKYHVARESQKINTWLWYAAIGVVLFIVLLALPFMCDRAHAEPQRLTTADQRAQIAARKQAKADNIPDVQKFEEDIDKAFPDKKQTEVIKKLARMVTVMKGN